MSEAIGNATATRILPRPDRWTRPFWEHARQGYLALPACTDCGNRWYPPGPVCPKCLSPRFEWTRVSGRGTVRSWVVFHQVYYPEFASEAPYNVALVEVEEGVHLISNLVGIANGDIRVGLQVEAVFDQLNDEFSLPKFRPVTQV